MTKKSAYQWIRERSYNDNSLRRAITEAVKCGLIPDSEAYTYYKDISREMGSEEYGYALG